MKLLTIIGLEIGGNPMRKLCSSLCLVGLLLLIPVLLQARHILPLDTRPLVAEKYEGWTGVLSLWIYEGWPCGCGSIAPWLNDCISAFEKDHPGTYVQPLYVDAGAIASINESGILPPDMLLFPPNLLETPKGLLPLEDPPAVRSALRNCGEWRGAAYAMPVAMGGYLWAWNNGIIDAIPDTWQDSDAILSVPAPQSWRHWDVALLALCSGRYAPVEQRELTDSTSSPVGEVELGLIAGETPFPTVTPSPQTAARLSRRLPPDFQYDDNAWRHFVNGESAAMPVTQREVRRLQALSEQGKGPQWQLCPGDCPFTDQLLSLAIVNRRDDSQRRALCLDFLAWLLSDACQSSLCRASAFSVTNALSGYDAADPLSMMEATLRDPTLSAPRIFDRQWASRAEEIVRNFASNFEDAPTLWKILRHLLAENTNN